VYILLSCFILWQGHLLAQEGYSFTRIGSDDGLSSNDVRAIHQDEKGFLWIGTANGLQRFDGHKFITFTLSTRNATDKLPISTLEFIIPGKNGILWLYFPEMREVGIFDPGKFTYKRIPIKNSTPLPARITPRLWKDSRTNIYLSIHPVGIFGFDEKEQAFLKDRSPFTMPKGWTATPFSSYDKKNDYLWICADSGLVVYDYQQRRIYHKGNNPLNIPLLNNLRMQEAMSNIFIDQKNRYWIYQWPSWANGSQVVHCLDSNGTVYSRDTIGLTIKKIRYGEYRDMVELPRSGLWVYGLDKLFSYNTREKKFNSYNNEQFGIAGIHYEVVNQVIEDREHCIWVATNEGIYFSPPGNDGNGVQNILFKENNGSREFTDILELKNGDYWLANWGQGVLTMDKRFQPRNYEIFKDFPASWTINMRRGVYLTWCLHQEKATGDVWIGANSGYLTRYNPETNKRSFYAAPEFDKATIRYITEDKAGRIWFSTQRGRIVVFEDNKFRVVKDFGSSVIFKIFFDSDGWLWAGIQGLGVYALDPISGRILQHYEKQDNEKGLYANTGSDIDQLNDSVIAYGAGALNLINKRNGKVRVISYEQGLPSNSVRRIRKDRLGHLWIITNNGLCRFNPFNDHITPYSNKDGILLGEKTVAADYICSEGYVMFAGSNALMFFQPELFDRDQEPPNVTITDFKLFNSYLPIDSLLKKPAIQLSYDQNTFSIHFSSLSYLNKDKLIYYYRMVGISDQWIRADRIEQVNYSVLPPGKYSFQVYCENIGGTRSKATTIINIHIAQPYWKSWWFLTLIGLGILGILYLMHRMRINRLLAVENLRSRVARDLHDDMGSTLSTINILSTMAKGKLSSDIVRTSEYLGKISDNSQRMMEAMDDIVWSIKPDNDSMQKITARMREIATSVLEAKDIELIFRIEPAVEQIKLDMEARRDFFLIFKEAINNIAKYSKASQAQVHMAIHHKRLMLMIKDNGIGFDIDKADGNGLGNMHKRAMALKGRLQIQSVQGEGTQITLNIPIQ
jgi:ligand-binding sensor domain-containing protein/two-component sensor histidine kinase